MSIKHQLASSLGQRDEMPNIALAEILVTVPDPKAIAELVDLTTTGTKPLRHDAIKVLYEIGERAPDQIAPHLDALIALLSAKDNRMLWGTLFAIDTLGGTCPEKIMPHLNIILEAADFSSVIAKDKTTHLLTTLNGDERFTSIIEPVLLERLSHAAVNQFPMYAEFAAETISDAGRAALIDIIKKRQASISYPAKKQRLERLLRKMKAL